MYSKEQASHLKHTFWTAFGQYMSPVLSAEGEKVSWINYKTGIKHVYFRMQAGSKSASIAIELTHPDAGIQELYFQQFTELKTLLQNAVGEEWDWQLHATGEHGETMSRIAAELPAVSIFNQADWPQLISFFKPRIIALDAFWADAKYAFDSLK